jgi:short-subunit dehydrogenase
MLTRAFLEIHKQNKNQKRFLVNISSILGVFPVGYLTIYSASKAYIEAFSMGLSEEEYHNIRILNVSPFYVSTKMTGF